MICCFVLFGNGFYLTSSVIEYTYAHVAHAEPHWFLQTDSVQAQLMNTSTLCGMFPAYKGQIDFCEK